MLRIILDHLPDWIPSCISIDVLISCAIETWSCVTPTHHRRERYKYWSPNHQSGYDHCRS